MKNYLILCLITFFALVFRIYGIKHDLPFVFNVDEPYIMDKAVEVADGNLRHGIIIRGSLPYYVNGFAIRLATLIKPPILIGQKTIISAYKQNRTSFYIIGRTISVLYSLMEIIILFFLGKILFGNPVGLLGAFFASISLLSINYSHLATPDTALSTTILFTTFLIVLAYIKNSYLLFLIASLFIGFSAAQKLPGILTLPVFLLFFIFSKLFRNQKLENKISFFLSFIIGIFIAYWLSYPYLFQDIDKLIEQWLWENKTTDWWGELIIRDIGLFGRMYKYLFQWLHYGTGSLILLFGFVGMFILFIKKSIFGFLLPLFFIIFLLGISLPIPHYDRWVLPLVPFTCLFAAFFIIELFKKSHKTRKKSILFTFVILIFVSIAPLMKSIFLTQLFKSPDTRILEAEWVRRNKIDESKILRDLYTSINVPREGKMLTRVNLSDLQNYDYFIASKDFYQRFFYQEDIYPEKAEKYRYVFNTFPKIIEFTPATTNIYKNDIEFISSFQKWHLQQIKGPRITIYDLRNRVFFYNPPNISFNDSFINEN